MVNCRCLFPGADEQQTLATANNRDDEIDLCGGNEDDVWCSGLLRLAQREMCWQNATVSARRKKATMVMCRCTFPGSEEKRTLTMSASQALIDLRVRNFMRRFEKN
jgi:hypothetical protein